VGVGQATIKAAVGSVSASVAVTVTAATLQQLHVTPASASIARGTTQGFTARGTYSDGKIRDVSGMVAWSTRDQTIAVMLTSAGPAGTAKGMNVGQTDVTASVGSVKGSAVLTVTGASLQAIDVT